MKKFNLDNYVQVNERIAKWRAEHPLQGQSVAWHRIDEEGCCCTVSIWGEGDTPGHDAPLAQGTAEETRQGMINRDSAVENCETSALGRALAFLGYEVTRGVASREEMQKVERLQNHREKAGETTPATQGSNKRFVQSVMKLTSDDDLITQVCKDIAGVNAPGLINDRQVQLQVWKKIKESVV